MYSMNYIGKFIANFREFYNEINAATLTGAIDVVVVEQPDGSFTCSPFHVRFGKLGVLRSRFKVVDLELNGESLNIHMKLGESGEAFFVEEVGEDEAECSAHLATSPIPAGHFEDLYEPRRRNSLSAVEPDHSQASDYTKRRYTADGQIMQKPDLTKILKCDNNNKEQKDRKDSMEHEALFEMEGLDEVQNCWTDKVTPKTFTATEIGEAENEAAKTIQKISAQNDFRPIDAILPENEDFKQNGSIKKKKKTKKVGSKKKHQRKSSTSSISSQSDRAGSEQRTPQSNPLPITDINFFSDTEIISSHALSGSSSRPRTPVQSDTEVELTRTTGIGEKGSQSWRWGELPEPPPRGPASLPSPTSPASPESPSSPTEPLSSDEERGTGGQRRGVLSGMFRFISTREANEVSEAGGVYLDDLDRGQVDPNLYFPKHHSDQHRKVSDIQPHVQIGPTEEEYESGNGPSLPQSPASLEPPALDSDDDEKMLAKGQIGVYVREDNNNTGTAVSRALSYDEFCARAAELLSVGSDRVLVRVGERYLPWPSAGPLLLSLLTYRRPLPNRVLDALAKDTIPNKEPGGNRVVDSGGSKRYSWWSWRRSNVNDTKSTETSPPKDEPKSPYTLQSQQIAAAQKDDTQLLNEPNDDNEANLQDRKIEESLPEHYLANNETIEGMEASLEKKYLGISNEVAEQKTNMQDEKHDPASSDSDTAPVRPRFNRRHSTFRKTLRLSSDQIKSLNLRDGMNEMVFSVTTAYQGTTRCKCNVFRWRYDDKVVISDIDGTITKSDVLGHIFPLVGKDWAQSGVAQLFTKIKNNGYKLLYLSARAIGQARVTREYLRSIRQGEVCLPDGPLLLNPTSLLRAFHREVIEKKPEEFKIQCLADIKALFPTASNPFYAGYGNRVNDVCAYQAVGIPIVRIFTINYKGELKHELTQTFQSTYSHMSVLVDQVFPPTMVEPCDDFSQLLYWRESFPVIEQLPLISAPNLGAVITPTQRAH